MASFKYFTNCQGEQSELQRVCYSGNLFDVVRGAECSPGGKSRPWQFIGFCRHGHLHAAQRAVEMKAFPSRHQCDARCMNGRPNGRCECQCNGKNHGAGMFSDAGAFRNAA